MSVREFNAVLLQLFGNQMNELTIKAFEQVTFIFVIILRPISAWS